MLTLRPDPRIELARPGRANCAGLHARPPRFFPRERQDRVDITIASLTLAETAGAERRAAAVRERESAIAAALSRSAGSGRFASRRLASRGVSCAEAAAADATMGDAGFVDYRLGLRGEPRDKAPQRRQMRDRVRALRHLDTRFAPASRKSAAPAPHAVMMQKRPEWLAAGQV